MSTIWKFPFHIRDTVAIEMPRGATVLPGVEPARLEHGGRGLVIWASVDPDQPTETRVFHVVGTGHDMPDTPLNYIGTAHDSPITYGGSTLGGHFVWHLFERVRQPLLVEHAEDGTIRLSREEP